MKRVLFAVLGICLLAPSLARAEWYLERKVDPMTDKDVCQVGTYDVDAPHLFALVLNGNLTFSVVGGRNMPGTSDAIRVDQNPAFVFTDRLSGDEAMKLLNQLETGERVRTRFTKWPQGSVVDQEGPVGDFAVKVRSCLEPPSH